MTPQDPNGPAISPGSALLSRPSEATARLDVEPGDGLLVLPEHEGRAVAGPGQGRRVNETGGTPGHGRAFARLERRHHAQPSLKVYLSHRFNEKASTIVRFKSSFTIDLLEICSQHGHGAGRAH